MVRAGRRRNRAAVAPAPAARANKMTDEKRSSGRRIVHDTAPTAHLRVTPKAEVDEAQARNDSVPTGHLRPQTKSDSKAAESRSQGTTKNDSGGPAKDDKA